MEKDGSRDEEGEDDSHMEKYLTLMSENNTMMIWKKMELMMNEEKTMVIWKNMDFRMNEEKTTLIWKNMPMLIVLRTLWH